MECIEIAEVVDQFSWAIEICITVFSGRNGFIAVCITKILGLILDLVAFGLASEAQAVCDSTDFGSDESDENDCWLADSGIYTTVIYYVLYQRIGAILMAIYTLKPWEWLQNKDGFCGTLKAKTFGMFYQDPKSRNERIRSAKLNMFFGAQWNLLDALSKRFTDATVPSSLGEEEDDTEDTKDTDNANDGQKTEDGHTKEKENNSKQGDAGTEPGGNTGGPSGQSGQTLTLNVNVNVPSTSATPADTREASLDRTNPAQDKPVDSNDNNTDNNNPDSAATPPETETATATTETTADTGNAVYTKDTKDTGDTAATDDNTNKTSTNTAATDDSTKAAADTTGSTSGKEGDLIEWEEHKTIFTIFGVMVIVEFGFWMAISGNAQDVFFFSDEADGEGLEFGELFPLLWSVFAGYYGMVEYIMIYFFAPLKTTTLKNNKQYSQYFKWVAYIMLVACTISTITFLFSIATFG